MEKEWLGNGGSKLTSAETCAVMSADEIAVDLSRKGLGPGKCPSWRRPFRLIWWMVQFVVGSGFLLFSLAALAAIPGVNLIALGMLLDAEARVARSGRLRDGFPLLDYATRIGTITVMTGLFLIPVLLLNSVVSSHEVLNQLSGLRQPGASIVKIVVQGFVFLHILLAIANGGSLLKFFRPLHNFRSIIRRIRTGEFFEHINYWSDRLLSAFQPMRNIWQATKAIVGAMIWLFLPTLLLSTVSFTPRQEPQQGFAIVVTFIGAFLLIPVAAWLPLLQCHQVVTGRFMAIFEVRKARDVIMRVPFRWLWATFFLYLLAVPLYLSKVVIPPADAYWLLTPLFIVTIYPTRLLIGWVYATGTAAESRRHFLLRWPFKITMFLLLTAYAFVLFAVPYISPAGFRGALDNHVFLLPIPGFLK